MNDPHEPFDTKPSEGPESTPTSHREAALGEAADVQETAAGAGDTSNVAEKGVENRTFLVPDRFVDEDGTLELLNLACTHPLLKKIFDHLLRDWITEYHSLRDDYISIVPRLDDRPDGEAGTDSGTTGEGAAIEKKRLREAAIQLLRRARTLPDQLGKAVIELDCVELDDLRPEWGSRESVRQSRKELIKILEALCSYCDTMLKGPLAAFIARHAEPAPVAGDYLRPLPSISRSPVPNPHVSAPPQPSSRSHRHHYDRRYALGNSGREDQPYKRVTSWDDDGRNRRGAHEARVQDISRDRSGLSQEDRSSQAENRPERKKSNFSSIPPEKTWGRGRASQDSRIKNGRRHERSRSRSPLDVSHGRAHAGRKNDMQGSNSDRAERVAGKGSSEGNPEGHALEKEGSKAEGGGVKHGEWVESSSEDEAERRRNKMKRRSINWAVKLREKLDRVKKHTAQGGCVTALYEQPVSRETLLTLLAKCEEYLQSPEPAPTQTKMAIETFIAGLECAFSYIQKLRVNKTQMRLLYESATALDQLSQPTDLLPHLNSLQGLLKTFGMF